MVQKIIMKVFMGGGVVEKRKMEERKAKERLKK